MDLLRFMREMRLALYQSGQVARGLQGQVRPETKRPDSVHQQSTAVSLADHLTQEILLLAAHAAAPDIGAQSEEMDACPASIRALFGDAHSRYALILDPIDGTDDYLAGRQTYGQMLGLLDQDTRRMACGMLHFPATQRTLMGATGVGAFRSQGFWGDLDPLNSSSSPPRSVIDTKRLLAADYAWFHRAGVTLAPNVSRSAAFELARVIRGEEGAMVMRQFHGYDTAIAGAILEALGGAVLDGDGRPVAYELNMPRLPVVVLSLDRELVLEIAEAVGCHAPDSAP